MCVMLVHKEGIFIICFAALVNRRYCTVDKKYVWVWVNEMVCRILISCMRYGCLLARRVAA